MKIKPGISITFFLALVSFFLFVNNVNDDISKTKKGSIMFAANFNMLDSIKDNTVAEYVKGQLAKGKKPNRLITEKSPYLLLHAFNPVDWYPWSEEAFEKARKEDKPIFLSVGYSTCYWCHVMEREVFENDSIAALMNKYVVAIKVDREERPDVDRVYMNALQAMTGSGGWPMSMFLTLDLKPFYGATYIPPQPQYGRPGFVELINAIHEAWQTKRNEIIESSSKITEYIKNLSLPATSVNIGLDELTKGYQSFEVSYDEKNGGFGKAPKFPRPVTLNFLLRYYARTGSKKALDMSLTTLKKMAEGGMYDQIGGGFHRYSTDEKWHVPHFEKMLYDQALLVISYLEAYQITHDKFYADIAKDILAFVKREMTDADGGFYSAQDAESAIDPKHLEKKNKLSAEILVKAEGAYYVWSKNEIDKILDKEEANVFDYYYGVKENGNVNPSSDPRGEFAGKNILFIAHSLKEAAAKFNLSDLSLREEKISSSKESLRTILSEAKKKIFAAREKRPKPNLDDKILTSWNGLMISAYSRAYEILNDSQYLLTAVNAAKFILRNLYDSKNQKLYHRYRDGEAKFMGSLEDYAFFVQGLLDLYEASLNIDWLEKAIELTKQQINLFYDSPLRQRSEASPLRLAEDEARKNGGFFDVSETDSTIIIRTKDFYDGAEPSGNSIAILNLLRLSQTTDNKQWREIAEKSLAYFGEQIKQSPYAMPQFLTAVDFSLSKPKQIIIAGTANDPHTKELLKEVHSRFIPNKIIMLADGKKGQKILASYIPFIESIKKIDGKSTAYICENYACKLPTSDTKVAAELLDEK